MSFDKKEHRKSWYAQAKEKGLCGMCGARPAQLNKVRCEDCGSKQRDRKDQLKEKGLCRDCGARPARMNRSQCEDCGSKQRARKDQLKEKGLCVYCGARPPRENKTRCEECAIKQRARKDQLKEKGLCAICGARPYRQGKVSCTECLERTHAIKGWAAKKAADQKHKGRPGLTPKTIVAVWEKQRGCCALLGVPLTLGVNVSVDHIIPVSKGGTSEESNIRIVHTLINNAKHNMSDTEFAAMIRVLQPWAQSQPREEVSLDNLDPEPVPELLHATPQDP